jgi:hypothetical protein
MVEPTTFTIVALAFMVEPTTFTIVAWTCEENQTKVS